MGSFSLIGLNFVNATGTYDEQNGGVDYTPETTLSHEMAHFIFPQSGLIKENGKPIMRAGEPIAVEWENMVRKDMGLDQRTSYRGVNVYGKEIQENNGNYSLVNKKNYGKFSGTVNNMGIPNSRQESRTSFIYKGRSINRYIKKQNSILQNRLSYPK